MNRKILIFYYSISIAILLFLLLFAAWRFMTAVERNAAQAQDAFADLKVSALSTYLAEGTFSSEYFRFNLKQQASLLPRLRLAAIYSPAGGIQYLLARDRTLLAPDNRPDNPSAGWNGQPAYRLRQFTERRFTTSFTQEYTLEAVFRVLEWTDLSPLLRELFYLLVVYLVITAVVLVAVSTAPRDGYVPMPAGRLAEAGKPQGLRSHDSGLGWREHLSTRLEHELERSASFDQDLALLLLALDPRKPAAGYNYRQLAQQVMSGFPFKDLCFEYDSRSVAVILPDKDLAQALKEAREFQKRLSSVTWSGGGRVAVSLGLSARNGRLINATRLLLEASKALQRAEADGGGRIVAFQADPEKYRAALAAAGAVGKR
jgi:GGDEF domain-containing protein